MGTTMLEPEPYLVRYEIDGKDEYVTIDRFDIVTYRCGLSAGDQIRVITDRIITEFDGKPTGGVMPKGEIHTVLRGSSDDPQALWLRKPGGETHTWGDDESIWEDFCRVED